MHPVLALAATIASGLLCAWIGYYAGVGAQQQITFKWLRAAHKMRDRADQLALANAELMAEIASMQAGERPLTPREAIALADIEYHEFEADQ